MIEREPEREKAALLHVEHAERLLVGAGTGTTRQISHVVVLGGGTMGIGIAHCLAAVDLSVTLVERAAEALDRALGLISQNFDRRVARGRLAPDQAERRKQAITGTLNLSEAVARADLVIEAVFEDMAVKKSVFSNLAEVTKPGTILATNTSYLDINVIAQSAGDRALDVIGLHFFSPADVMRLLEVIPATTTATDVLTTAMALGQRLGKIAVQSGICDGFIGNRLYSAYNREAEFLLQEGATVDQVDDALTSGFGMAMGSFAVRDLAGLDISWARRKAAEATRDKNLRYSKIGDMICERGWFGRKTGKGFYLYDPEAPKGSKPVANPDVDEIARNTARELGITRRLIDREEIIRRCMLAVVVEGARILDEGIARRARDIDLVHIYGYGAPKWRGGPMHWADSLGLSNVLDWVQGFDALHDYWSVPPLLRRLAEEGRNFSQFDFDQDETVASEIR